MLSTGFIGSACWSDGYMPVPYPLPFGSSVYSLISLVSGNDGSDIFAMLPMSSCQREPACCVPALFTLLYGLIKLSEYLTTPLVFKTVISSPHHAPQ